MDYLHIDIETYSSVSISKAGNYKYIESEDFEILMIAYAINDEPVKIIDLYGGLKSKDRYSYATFIEALQDSKITKCAHNANFERQSFKKIGFDIPIKEWYCTMVKAAYCGLPLGLGEVSKVLELEDKGKLAEGKSLIKYFCIPCPPTKVNGQRTRNLPEHKPDDWEAFKNYCMNDVEAEREIKKKLEAYVLPKTEQEYYILDQRINDRGIEIDLGMAEKAAILDTQYKEFILEKIKELTGLENPNSGPQLKTWLSNKLEKEVKSIAKDKLPELLKSCTEPVVRQVLSLKQKASRTSNSKYSSMLRCALDSSRAHGLVQFYGANRTGRWAGRLVQVQNLPKNHLSDLDQARRLVKSESFEMLDLLYEDLSSILSQLIRTAFIAKKGHLFAVADYSAIEARVIAWFAGEQWRLDVFNSDGKIYEASGSKMFGIPIEEITKGSEARDKAKIAELALGYQGSVGALTKMGGEKMGLSKEEMQKIVDKWRAANPAIVSFWKKLEVAAKRAMVSKATVKTPFRGLKFSYDGLMLKAHLPSGRHLSYWKPSFAENEWGQTTIQYMGMNQTTKRWEKIHTYGGKLAENIVQAFARDILAYSMSEIDKSNFDIVLHVHDETACEIPEQEAEEQLKTMCGIMGREIPWAKDLPLDAEGYVTPYYKKD